MHRRDWEMPGASFVKTGDVPSITPMCHGKVQKFGVWEVMPQSVKDGRYVKRDSEGDLIDRRVEYKTHGFNEEGRYVYRWWEPCTFKSGHPGKCGSTIPDIFDRQGNVLPKFTRLFENRRNPDGTLAATRDERPSDPRHAADDRVGGQEHRSGE